MTGSAAPGPDVPGYAQRTMSAPPEVVFNTATDPERMVAWLPVPLHQVGPVATGSPDGGRLRARWEAAAGGGWSAVLRVDEVAAGGATARLEIDGDLPPDQLTGIATQALTCLASEVADNLTPG